MISTIDRNNLGVAEVTVCIVLQNIGFTALIIAVIAKAPMHNISTTSPVKYINLVAEHSGDVTHVPHKFVIA